VRVLVEQCEVWGNILRFGARSVRFGGTVFGLEEHCELWFKLCEVCRNSWRFGASSVRFGGTV